jgi:hypothetical protein
VGLLGGEVGAVVLLHRLGSAPGFGLPRGDPARWLHETPPLDATAALLRVLALAAAWWLLVSSVWWLVVAARGAAQGRGLLAMPGTRRLVEWTLALTIAGGAAMAGPGAWAAAGPRPGAAPTSTTAPGVRTGRGLAVVPAPAPATPPPTTAPTTPAPTTPAPATPGLDAAAGAPTPGVHVIAAGENLWTIAAARLGAVTNRAASAVPAAEIARYWRALCELNRATIRSGNPSLVYPGEVLQLPPA